VHVSRREPPQDFARQLYGNMDRVLAWTTDGQSIGSVQKRRIYSALHGDTHMVSANSVQRSLKPASAVVASNDALSVKAERFVASYMEHGNATRAYREAFDVSGMLPATIKRKAFDVLHSAPVAVRLGELRTIAAEALNTSVAELALQAHEIATATVHDLQPVEVYACRVCHSADGRHPAWIDADEYADACEAWAASQDSPKPLKKPDARGGFNHDVFAAPSPSCKACRGHGVPVMRTLPTADLSPGARQLYAGATVAPDGTLRVMVEDRTKWADMRNKLLGLYVVKTESKSLNVSMTAAEVAAIASRTPDEIVQLLFKRKGATP
jgi:hypothetical protein